MKKVIEMTQEERRYFLIRSLMRERPQLCKMSIPEEGEEQKQLLRALMNQRRPSPAPPGFLDVQDAYLKEETLRRGIVDCRELSPAGAEGVKRRLFLWQGDITRLKADAIVNAANEALLDAPEAINADPYGAWLVEVEAITGQEELLDAAAYEAHCAAEG